MHRFSPKKAKPGAFWVLEGMGTVAGRCEQMGKPGKLGENQGTDLVSAAASVGSQQSATGARSPHDTHRRQACGRTSLPNPTVH